MELWDLGKPVSRLRCQLSLVLLFVLFSAMLGPRATTLMVWSLVTPT